MATTPDKARGPVYKKAVAGSDKTTGTKRNFYSSVMEWQPDQVEPHIPTLMRGVDPTISGPQPTYDDTGHAIDTELLGPELLTNPNLRDSGSGWTDNGVAILTEVAGGLRVENSGTNFGWIQQDIDVEVGKTYRVAGYRIDAMHSNPAFDLRNVHVGNSQDDRIYYADEQWENGPLDVVATDPVLSVRLLSGSNVQGEYVTHTNISVREIDPEVVQPPVPANVKIILGFFGQSNAEGYVEQPPGFTDYPTGVMQLDLSNNIVQATSPLAFETPPNNSFAFHLQFVKELIAEHPTAEILIVPVADGGTGFGDDQWNPGDRLYNLAVSKLQAAIAKPGWEDADVRVLWCQGERDKVLGTTEPEYVDAWRAMRSGIDTAVGKTIEWMPYDLAEQYHSSPPIQAFRNTLRYDTGVHLVRGGDAPLISTGDGTHYDATEMGADLVGSHFWTGAVAAGWVTQTPAPVDLSVVNMWSEMAPFGGPTYTYSPPWTGGTDGALIILCGSTDNRGSHSLTVNGVTVEPLHENYTTKQWMAVYDVGGAGSGNIVYTAADALAVRGPFCAVVEYNGTDTLIVEQFTGIHGAVVPGDSTVFITATMHGFAGNPGPAVPNWTVSTRVEDLSEFAKYALDVGYHADADLDLTAANNVNISFTIAGIADSIKETTT